MVDWKFYIDSPQQRALDLCGGSLTEGDGRGCGNCVGGGVYKLGAGYGLGDGSGGGGSRDGHGPLAHRGGDGVSADKW